MTPLQCDRPTAVLVNAARVHLDITISLHWTLLDMQQDVVTFAHLEPYGASLIADRLPDARPWQPTKALLDLSSPLYNKCPGTEGVNALILTTAEWDLMTFTRTRKTRRLWQAAAEALRPSHVFAMFHAPTAALSPTLGVLPGTSPDVTATSAAVVLKLLRQYFRQSGRLSTLHFLTLAPHVAAALRNALQAIPQWTGQADVEWLMPALPYKPLQRCKDKENVSPRSECRSGYSFIGGGISVEDAPTMALTRDCIDARSLPDHLQREKTFQVKLYPAGPNFEALKEAVTNITDAFVEPPNPKHGGGVIEDYPDLVLVKGRESIPALLSDAGRGVAVVPFNMNATYLTSMAPDAVCIALCVGVPLMMHQDLADLYGFYTSENSWIVEPGESWVEAMTRVQGLPHKEAFQTKVRARQLRKLMMMRSKVLLTAQLAGSDLSHIPGTAAWAAAS